MKQLLVFALVSTSLSAKTENSFTSFVTSYLSKDVEISLVDNRLEQAKNNLNLEKYQNHRLNFLASPNIRKSLADSENLLNVTTSLNQRLPYGTELGLAYSRNSQQDTFGNDISQDNWALSLNQSLGRNRFGNLTELRIAQRSSRVDLAKQRQIQSSLDRCIEGAKLYTELYYRQQSISIAKRLHIEAQKILTYSKDNYSNKLIDEINYLSAQANEVNSKSFYEREKNDLDRLKILTKVALNDQPYSTLDDPTPALSKLNIKSFTGKKSLAERTYDEEIKVLEIAKREIDESAKTQIDLSFETGTNSYQGYPVVPGYDRYIQAGFVIDIPVKESVSSLSRRDNALKISEQRLIQKSVKNNKDTVLFQFSQELDSLESRLKLSTATIAIYEQQNKQGYKQFQNSKIEFEIFLDFHNRLLNELINQWQIKFAIWQLKLTALQWADHNPQFCRGERV